MMMMDWRRNVFENGSYFRKVFDYVRGVNAVNAHLRAASGSEKTYDITLDYGTSMRVSAFRLAGARRL